MSEAARISELESLARRHSDRIEELVSMLERAERLCVAATRLLRKARPQNETSGKAASYLVGVPEMTHLEVTVSRYNHAVGNARDAEEVFDDEKPEPTEADYEASAQTLFDGATAKPLSKWLTRAGDVFTFGAFNPEAGVSRRVVGWIGDSEDFSCRQDGRYDVSREDENDIVGPYVPPAKTDIGQTLISRLKDFTAALESGDGSKFRVTRVRRAQGNPQWVVKEDIPFDQLFIEPAPSSDDSPIVL